MRAQTSLGGRPPLRFRGKVPRWQIAIVPALPLVGWVALLLVTGATPQGRYIAFLSLFGLFGVLGFLSAFYLNCMEVRDDALKVSFWVVVPVRRVTVPYDEIESVEVGQKTGSIGITFMNDRGEADYALFTPRSLRLAAQLVDEIRIHRSSFKRLDLVVPPAPAPADVTALLAPVKAVKFAVVDPAYMRWACLWAPPVGLIFGLFEGLFVAWKLIAFAAFFCGMIAILYVVSKFHTYVVVRTDRVDMKSGPFGKIHRIRYSQVLWVGSTDAGWL